MTTWVFGYGSLVAPESVGDTIGRQVDRARGYGHATLAGFGRRWNYGSLRQRATWVGPHGRVEGGIVVSLGVEQCAGEHTNGSVVRVDDAEIARLDIRESDYDRIDVTDLVSSEVLAAGAVVMTYVPRLSAIERYERARADRTAAVRRGYVELVESAFASLGAGVIDTYRATTPEPDVPVVEFEHRWLEGA